MSSWLLHKEAEEWNWRCWRWCSESKWNRPEQDSPRHMFSCCPQLVAGGTYTICLTVITHEISCFRGRLKLHFNASTQWLIWNKCDVNHLGHFLCKRQKKKKIDSSLSNVKITLLRHDKYIKWFIFGCGNFCQVMFYYFQHFVDCNNNHQYIQKINL